jgi:two-component system phosphate regulon sensor histidine kinase PhoR
MNRLARDMDEHVTGLRDEGARLRAVLDGMAEGVMVTDDEGRIALWNESFGRLFPGIPPAGRRPIEVVRSPDLQDAIRDAARDPAPVAREIPLAERTFIVRVARIGREVGPSERIVAVFNDVTEMRRGERMRRDFVANASHELRTPIATVRAAAETILAIGDSLPDAARRFTEMIHRQSQRMGQLVDDMLRLSELESSYRPIAKVVDMTVMVEQVLSAARARAGQRALKLEQEVARGTSAMADPAAVEQILTNLVDNACKYTPDGGRIDVRARAQDGQVILEVRDTGPGISREHLSRLFERFYRVDSGRAREHGGTGLGLAIVKHLVVANRGEVSVTSDVGRGSTFIVKLPRAGG